MFISFLRCLIKVAIFVHVLLLLTVSLYGQISDVHKAIIKKTVELYAQSNSYIYDMHVSKKSFDDDSFYHFNSKLHLILNDADTHFKCHFYYTVQYDHDTTQSSKYYNGDKLILVDPALKTYTSYDPNKGQKSPISNSIDGIVIDLTFVFNAKVIEKELSQVIDKILYVDTIINNTPYLAQIYHFPDNDNYTDISRIICINKKTNYIDRIYSEAHYFDQVQLDIYLYNNIKAQSLNYADLDSLLQHAILPHYEAKVYERRKPELLSQGSDLPPINVKLYPSNNEIVIDTVSKITILDFWYTSCMPCIQSIPILNKIYEKYKDKVNMYGVNASADDINNPVKIEQFLNRTPIDYPIVLANWDELNDYKVVAFPTLYIFDKSGKLVFSEVGFSDAVELFNKIDKALSDLIK